MIKFLLASVLVLQISRSNGFPQIWSPPNYQPQSQPGGGYSNMFPPSEASMFQSRNPIQALFDTLGFQLSGLPPSLRVPPAFEIPPLQQILQRWQNIPLLSDIIRPQSPTNPGYNGGFQQPSTNNQKPTTAAPAEATTVSSTTTTTTSANSATATPTPAPT